MGFLRPIGLALEQDSSEREGLQLALSDAMVTAAIEEKERISGLCESSPVSGGFNRASRYLYSLATSYSLYRIANIKLSS